MKKQNLIFILIFIFIIILNNFVSAHFICGEVSDASDMSSNWVNVRLFFPEKPELYSECEISPDGNKYCCDAESITYRKWKIGDVLSAGVYDNESGYVAGSVTLKTSGEGYDVMPPMNLTKFIKINKPIEKLVVQNSSNFKLEISINPNGKESKIFLNDFIIETNQSEFSDYVSGSYGLNNIRISSLYQSQIYQNEKTFVLLSSIGFSRKFDCPGCNNEKIKTNQIVDINLTITPSHEVTGLEFVEYVPIDFEILNSYGGEIKKYSNTHNKIVWNLTGKNFNINYQVRSPKLFIFPKKYVFRSFIEDYNLSEQNVIVYWAFTFFSFTKDLDVKNVKINKFSQIQPENALVIYPKNIAITKLVLFPNDRYSNVEVVVYEYIPKEKIEESIDNYLIDNNIGSENFDKMYVEFSYDKKFMEKNSLINFSLFTTQNDEWKKENIEIIKDSNESLIYGGYVGVSDCISIVGEKKDSIWNYFQFLNPFS